MDLVLGARSVIELMHHPDAHVRRAAVEWFAYASDVSPLSTRDVFRVVDSWSFGAAERLFWDFQRLPSSPACVERLRQLALAEAVPRSIRWAIANLDLETTLRWTTGSDADRLNPEVEEAIAFRREIRGRDPRQLWQAHEEMFLDQDPEAPWQPSSPRYDALVAELRQSPREVGALAVAVLEYWSRFWSSDDRPGLEEEAAYNWLASCPHLDALPLLVRASFGPDRRFSDRPDVALRACGNAAFEHVARAYRKRIDGACPYFVAYFRVPEAEDVLIESLRNETDDYERTIAGVALCTLFPTKGLPVLLDVVQSGSWLPNMESLDHHLIVAANAAQWDAPGMDEVRAESARRDAEARAEYSGIYELGSSDRAPP